VKGEKPTRLALPRAEICAYPPPQGLRRNRFCVHSAPENFGAAVEVFLRVHSRSLFACIRGSALCSLCLCGVIFIRRDREFREDSGKCARG
jgi:hypothetical protein